MTSNIKSTNVCLEAVIIKNQFLQTPVRDTLQDPMPYRIVASFLN